MTLVTKNCKNCFHFEREEVGDSDFLPVLAERETCSKLYDTHPDSEEIMEDFDRDIPRSCCVPNFWSIVEKDDDLKRMFDSEVDGISLDFPRTLEEFNKRYNGQQGFHGDQ